MQHKYIPIFGLFSENYFACRHALISLANLAKTAPLCTKQNFARNRVLFCSMHQRSPSAADPCSGQKFPRSPIARFPALLAFHGPVAR